ncbi:MAG: RNA-directed DNA polymerase [Proteobacteria bacterium]|nr:RNA-directed DNA polymerase [Pseudomonadota bacterium]
MENVKNLLLKKLWSTNSEPVGEPIDWCSQMIIIQKSNGKLRRTVDFQKLNSQYKRETHHCQPPFSLATQIPANVIKTVMNAVDGYHAVPLHPDSRPLTTFITQWGAYRYKRLPQGFLASGDAYTRRYDDLISHVPRKVKCIDDVLIWDSDIETAFFRTWDYLTFCAENGIVLSKQKFKFCRDEVEFAGLKITKSGIAPSEKILKAISEFPSPTNITDARSWFGLVNQVS